MVGLKREDVTGVKYLPISPQKCQKQVAKNCQRSGNNQRKRLVSMSMICTSAQETRSPQNLSMMYFSSLGIKSARAPALGLVLPALDTFAALRIFRTVSLDSPSSSDM